ncbi:MAG: hypothetical protein KDD69_17170, partial [Bdellovibrionales bacterium]|nr:hypothetical protein [Bdellovibrionales bacterium]
NAPAEYGIFGRLEAIMLVLSGIVLLREKLSIVKAAGVSVAFLASICLITTWDVSHQALFYGSVYVIGMTVGGVIVKQLLDQKVASPVALLMLRTWTVAASAVGVVLVNGALFHVVRNGIQFTDVLVATATGVTMLVIIGFRYQALTRIQLWEFSAMAPVSAVVSTILLRIGGAELGAGPALAMILIGVGEALVHSRSLLRSRAEAEVM